MSEIKLKSCPFCCCSNIQFWKTDNDTHRFQIVCMQCFNGTDECISEEVAIEKWNARTPMANIVEKLEERESKSLKKCKEEIELFKEEFWRGRATALQEAINILKQEINNGLE